MIPRSAAAIRQLLTQLKYAQHTLVADTYVQTEAPRNIAAKADTQAISDLKTLLGSVEVTAVQFAQQSSARQSAVQWLPEKDRPVLTAAIALGCDELVTDDRTHLAAGFGKRFEGVLKGYWCVHHANLQN